MHWLTDIAWFIILWNHIQVPYTGFIRIIINSALLLFISHLFYRMFTQHSLSYHWPFSVFLVPSWGPLTHDWASGHCGFACQCPAPPTTSRSEATVGRTSAAKIQTHNSLSILVKEPLLLIEKSSTCGGSGFPLLLSEWSFTICLTPYNRR